MAKKGSRTGRRTGTSGRRPGGKPGDRTARRAQRAVRGARDKRGRLVRVVLPFAIVVIFAVVVLVGVQLASTGQAAPTASSPNTSYPGMDTSSAVLASTANESTGDTVDGIASNDMEQVLFHVHAHLAIYVNGKPKLLPYGVGIVPPYQLEQTSDGLFVAGGAKYYWLHTHDETGVIHIESPVDRSFTLGEFFDIWRQPLSASRVGPATGRVTAFLDGHPFTGNPRDLPLTAHAVLQLDVGTVVPPQPYTFPSGL